MKHLLRLHRMYLPWEVQALLEDDTEALHRPDASCWCATLRRAHHQLDCALTLTGGDLNRLSVWRLHRIHDPSAHDPGCYRTLAAHGAWNALAALREADLNSEKLQLRHAHVVLTTAAAYGHLDVWRWAATVTRGWLAHPQVQFAAALAGRLEFLAWLHDRRTATMTWHPTTLVAAARGGCLRTVQWLHDVRGISWPRRALYAAAVGGHLPVLQWRHERQRLTVEAIQPLFLAAVQAGHLGVAQWLCHADDGAWPHLQSMWAEVWEAAATGGHVHALQWLRELAGPAVLTTPRALTRCYQAAAAGGHTPVLEFLHATARGDLVAGPVVRPAWADDVLRAWRRAAPDAASLRTVQWLNAHVWQGNAPLLEGAAHALYRGLVNTLTETDAVAANQLVACLEWWRTEAKWPVPADVLRRGLDGRTIVDQYINFTHKQHAVRVLRWLHAHTGLALTEALAPRVFEQACVKGRVDVLEFLRGDLGLRWRTPRKLVAAVVVAVSFGASHLGVLRWLHTHYRRHLRGIMVRAWAVAAEQGHLAVLQWLQAHYPLERAVQTHLGFVRRWRVSERTASLATVWPQLRKHVHLSGAMSGTFAVLQWLQAHGYGCDDPDHLYSVARIALHEHRYPLRTLQDLRARGWVPDTDHVRAASKYCGQWWVVEWVCAQNPGAAQKSVHVTRLRCCGKLQATGTSPRPHRWRRVRGLARAVQALQTLWRAVVERRYAPGGAGFQEAQTEFQATAAAATRVGA